MLSEEQLAVWERLAKEATEGPWYFSEYSSLCQFHGTDNARFICAAREAVPALIAEVRNLRENLKQETVHLVNALERYRKTENEADWLAHRISITDICAKPKNNATKDCGGDECAECWRDAARKAVNSSTNC